MARVIACPPLADGFGHIHLMGGIYTRVTAALSKAARRQTGGGAENRRAFAFFDIAALAGRTALSGRLLWGTRAIVIGPVGGPYPFEFCFISTSIADADDVIYANINTSTTNYATRATVDADTSYPETLGGDFLELLQEAIDTEAGFFGLGIKIDDGASSPTEVELADAISLEVTVAGGGGRRTLLGVGR